MIEDDWEKPEEEEIGIRILKNLIFPNQRKKSLAGKKGKEEDDFKLDDDFKDLDLFNDGDDDDDEEDF